MKRNSDLARLRRFGWSLARRATLVLLGASLLSVPWLRVAHHVHAQDAVRIRVEVTDDGFNGVPGDLTIDAPQGQLVELTFVWAHRLHTHDEHIMVLDGYKLESDKITAQNRETTLRFVADKAGTFGFKCDLDCEAHDVLQRGRLRVRAGAGVSSAASLSPTTLAVVPSSREVTNGVVTLMTTVKDEKGAPIPKAPVRFLLETKFGGVKGRVAVGTATTDANGVAFLHYQPTTGGPQTITARFEGQGIYAESERAAEIDVQNTPPSYAIEPIGLETVRGAAPAALALVVLALWATFAFVLYQAIGIARVRRRE
jgi:hypothetical protein